MSEKNELENILKLKIRKEELISKVHQYVSTEGLTYSEAIMEVAEERKMEPEEIAQLVTGPLKEKLRIESVDRKVISGSRSKTNKLIARCL